MNEKSYFFKLILRLKEFEIPSNFLNLNDANPDIIEKLLKYRRYEVKSDVNEITFKLFLDHWVKNKIPEIIQKNIYDFDQLSQEFDRMKDIVEIYKKWSRRTSFFALQSDNNKMKKQIPEKHDTLKNNDITYQKIIEFLFHSKDIDFISKSMKNKDELSIFSNTNNIEKVFLYTRKKVTHDGITYALFEEDQTAGVFQLDGNKEDIFIPRTINDESGHKYLVTSIFQISNSTVFKLNSISFPEDSEVRVFYPSIFFNFGIQKLVIPSSLVELKDGWCFHSIELKEIIVLPQNKIFTFYDNKFLIGKSDPKSDIYDILHFARRDIEEAIIPSFIKKIAPYAFNFCLKLEKVQFENNSQLISIGPNAFSETKIKSISIPSSVTSILKSAFYLCSHLKKVEFENDSNLITIDRNVFQQTQIEELSIPSSIVDFNEYWCNDTSKLKIINVIPNKHKFICLYNDNLLLKKHDIECNVFDIILFALRNIKKVTIPSFIKIIAPFAFSDCRCLKNIDFSCKSELISIDNSSFHSSTIKFISIPKHVQFIGRSAFNLCRRLDRIKFHKDSELKIIGENAFSFSSIKSISIPSKVKKICSHAFTNCFSLKIVEIPENINLQSSNQPLFNNTRNVIIMIPAKIRDIFHFKVPTISSRFTSFFKT